VPRERRSPPSPWRRLRRRLAPLRPLRPYVLALLALVVVAGLWGAYRAFALQRSLTRARAGIPAVEAALRSGDAATASARLAGVREHTAKARGITRDPVWRLGGHLPFVRKPIRTSTGVAVAADRLATEVLPELVTAADVLGARRGTVGTRVDVAPFRAAAPPLGRAATALASVEQGLAGLPFTGVGRVDGGRDEALRRVRSLRPVVDGAQVAATLVPDLLGSATPKRFFLAVQNNAESRASGGLFGAYGIVTAANGRIGLERVGSNDELPRLTRRALDLSPELAARYGRLGLGIDWRSANLSPHFPTTGSVVAAMWQAGTGQRLDGVLAVDPVALARVLEVTGPVPLADGTSVTAANAVDLLLRGFYERFPTGEQAPAKNTFLRDTARAVFARLDRGQLDARRLAERLGASAGDGHLQLWLADPARQALLERTALAGALPEPEGAFLSVVTQNVAGTKLDYYLRRTVRYAGRATGDAVSVGGDPVPVERATVEVTLANTAPPSGLPPYVTVRPDAVPGVPVPRGQNKLWVSLYLPGGTQLRSATVDGKPVSMESATERGLVVLSYVVTQDPGARTVLRVEVDALVRVDTFTYRPQPLAFPDAISADRG
jgi:hypothetical protein